MMLLSSRSSAAASSSVKSRFISVRQPFSSSDPLSLRRQRGDRHEYETGDNDGAAQKHGRQDTRPGVKTSPAPAAQLTRRVKMITIACGEPITVKHQSEKMLMSLPLDRLRREDDDLRDTDAHNRSAQA